jgi:hypothetical protein
MKLTKGKITKCLLKDKQTKKKYNIEKTKIKTNKNNYTYKKKQVFNLKNKTIKQMGL